MNTPHHQTVHDAATGTVIEYTNYTVPRKLLWGMLVLTWLFLSALAGAVAYFMIYGQQVLASHIMQGLEQQAIRPVQENLLHVADSVDTLRAELDSIKQVVAHPETNKNRDQEQALQKRLTGLEAELGKLKQQQIQIANKTPAKSIKPNTDAASSSDQFHSSQAKKASASKPLLQAVIQLRDGASKGVPFANDFLIVKDQAKNLVDFQPVIMQLEPLVNDPLPGLEQLKATFQEQVPTWLHPPVNEEASVLKKTLHQLSGFVTARPVGEDTQGNGSAAIIARAEAALNQGNLEQTVTELKALPAWEKEQALPFIKEVERKILVEKLINQLYNRASLI